METERTLTSYCGLYCRDCIPSNRRLFALAGELEDKLAELHFEEYAAHKARGDAAFLRLPEIPESPSGDPGPGMQGALPGRRRKDQLCGEGLRSGTSVARVLGMPSNTEPVNCLTR